MTAGERTMGAVAALLGGLGVISGAFAAHVLAGPEQARAAQLLALAAQYQLWHALGAILALLLGGAGRPAAASFIAGCILFSGSLTALAFGAPTGLARAAPLGGGLFILGWLLLGTAILGRRERRP
jgi:uncharacterized membrane protein YgdD (TMEM256/DUF423 family)